MASYRRIEVKPIAGALGAEIHGVNLATMDDDTFYEIKSAWLEHLVVFFRNQKITPRQQIAFAKRFGEIHYHPFMEGMQEHPEILEIIKEEGDTRAFGEVWHTDQMSNPKPAKATILYAKETPAAGGDTIFANMYLAYDKLSEPMKGLLEDVRTWNVGEYTHVGNEKMLEKVRNPENVSTETAHPLVRTHPETGRKAVYISNHTQTLAGFKRAEAQPIVDFLMAHAVQPEFTCRFHWEVGSMAVWDNRCTQHRAINDYPGRRRRMHRITIAGDAPF